jgi:hypothetical protein
VSFRLADEENERDELAALSLVLAYVQKNADRLDGLAALAVTLARMADEAGHLDVASLTRAEMDELWGLLDHVADENGLRWSTVI